MSDYQPGDVLERMQHGQPRWVRIVDDPYRSSNGRHCVQDCDAGGFVFDGKTRELRTTTLDRYYRLHYRVKEQDA